MLGITVQQLMAHAIGDWALQSDWMAWEKSKKTFAALVHSIVYALPFYLWFRPSWDALVVIAATHFLIDRFRVARFVIYARNFLAPYKSRIEEQVSTDKPDGSIHMKQIKVRVQRWWWRWRDCNVTGSPTSAIPGPAFTALGITDALMHLFCNAAALSYLTDAHFSGLAWLKSVL